MAGLLISISVLVSCYAVWFASYAWEVHKESKTARHNDWHGSAGAHTIYSISAKRGAGIANKSRGRD